MRIWTFTGCEFDEEQRKFWVAGKAVSLGDRVLDVLHALLSTTNHSRTSIALSRLWGPDGSVDSVKDAIRQLRRAVRQGGITEQVIRTVRGRGFQVVGAVTVRNFELQELWGSLKKDADAPGLPGWELQVPLEPGPRCRVWQIREKGGQQVRVVKYATDPARKNALRREVRAWEAFERGLETQKPFVRILSFRLTTSPCFVESEYGGLNLMAWSEVQRLHGGLSREVCLQVMADLAEALGKAHSLGVVHNDLKPSNILLSPGPRVGGFWQVKVADFGVASVIRNNRLAEFQLGDRTLLPFNGGVGGTSLYHAPEVGPGVTPTPEADIYALGVILFQLLCGDYGKTPYPGWEQAIGDPILQADIEAACNVNAARRPKAPILAEWLRTVEARREKAALAETRRREEQERVSNAERTARETQQRLAAELAKRPFQRALVASLSLLVIALAASALLAIRNLRAARDKAREETQQAETIQRFMEQLFFDGDAAVRGPITAEQLAERGLQKARLLESQPVVHAGLLNTLGTGFEVLGNYPRAEQVLQRALDERRHLFGADSPQFADTLIQQAALKSDEHEAQAAMELAKRALLIQQNTLAADDIAITRSQNKVAEIHTELGQYDQAVPLLEGAIAREKGHPDLLEDVSNAYNNLGVVENYRGHLERSLELQEQSMAIDRELQGARHPDIAEHLLSIANGRDLLGQYGQAASESREALSILQDWLPPGHHEISAAEAHLGTELAHLPPSRQEAKKLLQHAIATLSHEPKRSRTEAYALLALASLNHQQGADAEALSDYKRSLTIYQQLYPQPDFAWTVPLTGIASIAYEKHQWKDLQPVASQAYEIASEKLPVDDPRRLNASLIQARSLIHQSRPLEAQALLQQIMIHAPEGDIRTSQSREAAQMELSKLRQR